jgi:hypothetical protein
VRKAGTLAVLTLAVAVLLAAAWLRGAEYDEQYTLFLTGGTVRPVWPERVLTAGEIKALQSDRAGFTAVARDLRTTDVHPPLYFWAVAAWRRTVGDGLFAARLLSVLCGVATLGIVAAMARTTEVSAMAAVLLTLGCYGFVYTSVVARGFALALLLSVGGLSVLLKERRERLWPLCGGMLLGAATFTNYLAAFTGCAGLLWLWVQGSARRAAAVAAGIGFALWLPGDFWFFLAQRHSRVGQFAPFDLIDSVIRIARYAGANVFGGLPLYFTGIAGSIIATALGVLMVLMAVTIALCWRRVHPLFVMAALASPVGLLLLGVVFDNTPIELRYLAFATPFAGLLLASVLPRPMVCVVLAIQAASLFGLMTRPETMQPARATAAAAALLVRDGVVLLPHGNDGVGIVGAFAADAPPELRLLVIRCDETPERIRARVGRYRRIVLALLDQDTDSHATLPHMRAAFANTCWRAVGGGFNVLAFERICGEE